ncbi:MAG: uroporphyrinogen decarboxylase family protein [Lentisphaeria bacterium]|nr:uroporphyrinogen decarboxylase family protein [Lentisphaeria bacterium]
MNSRDRITAVLDHRLPDRVPLMELWIDPAVCGAILPGADHNELAANLGLDVVTALTMVYDEDEVEWVDTEQHLFRDKWGALQIRTEEALPVPAEPALIEGPADLASYRPPDPEQSIVIEKVRRLKQQYPDGEKAIAVIGESGWAPAVYLRGGLANLLLDFGLRPEFARDMMRIGVEYYSRLFELCADAGADVILLGDDYADKNCTLMSPAQFEEIILPGDAEVVAAIKRAGGRCIKHSDGNISAIVDLLVDIGIDCLGPLEPVPGMAPASILERHRGRISVMGNISVDLLSRGTAEEVAAATKQCLAEVSAAGPHILSSANTIATSVRPENFVTMVETTLAFGRYPLDSARLLAER